MIAPSPRAKEKIHGPEDNERQEHAGQDVQGEDQMLGKVEGPATEQELQRQGHEQRIGESAKMMR